MDSFSQTLLTASLLSTFYIGAVALLEAASRRFGWSPEVTRRIVHVFSGLSTLLDYFLLPSAWFVILITISLLGIAASQKFGWLTSVHSVRRRTYGEVFLPIGTLTTFAISGGDASYFVPALLIMTFSDAAAGITSDLLRLERKSFRGSLVFFAVTLGILLAFSVGTMQALLYALTLTMVERVSGFGSDNATVPAVAALLLRFL